MAAQPADQNLQLNLTVHVHNGEASHTATTACACASTAGPGSAQRPQPALTVTPPESELQLAVETIQRLQQEVLVLALQQKLHDLSEQHCIVQKRCQEPSSTQLQLATTSESLHGAS